VSAPGPDPATTRPPSEGGWFRFGAELLRPDGQFDPPSSDVAIWNPIPPFRPDVPPVDTGTYPPAGYAVVPAAARTPLPHLARQRLPETAVEYPQLLRGPTRAWWRPILTLPLFVLLFGVLSILPVLVSLAYGTISGQRDLGVTLDQLSDDSAISEPAAYLYLNLTLIALIPAAMLSIWAVHRIRPRFLSSVAGGLRWRWLLRCLAALAPLWAVYLIISTVIEPPQSARPEHWITLLVMGLLLTPWQAAAEEYAFRGWLTQNIGAYFARPLVAVVVPAIVAAAAFAAAHGSPDPLVLADLAAFSLTASFLTWRTGGLEAAIVLHTVNNVGIGIIGNAVGGFAESFVGADTESTLISLGVSLLMYASAIALVLWQARQAGVERWFRPTMSAAPSLPPQ